ncbi:MAG: hypothetical protein LBD97_06420, partial [Bifidobacteriaceae bacterium]|nr:hypothetical protein [Bifidobacteriaceae bacterium]
MSNGRPTRVPELPGLTGGKALGAGEDGDLFQMRDSATGAPRLVRVASAERVSREARILAKLADLDGIAHLVAESAAADGRPVIVTQFVEGATMRATLDARALPWAPAVRATVALARVIGAIHERGIVHGGIRPDHLVLASPAPVVIGFGEAMPIGGSHTASPDQREWSPPQVIGRAAPATPDIDVYALAAVLYALVTRRSPARAARKLARDATAPSGAVGSWLPPVTAPGAPEALNAALRHALAPRPDQRYQTMAEFSGALAAVLAGAEPPAPLGAQDDPDPVVPAPPAAPRPPSVAPERPPSVELAPKPPSYAFPPAWSPPPAPGGPASAV